MIAFDVRHYDSIGSTNDEALRLAARRRAARHRGARGRADRRTRPPVAALVQPAGQSLSVDRAAPGPAAARSVEIGFVAALAVADAVDALLPRQVRATLKWPNDVLVHDGKIAGILVGAGR